MSDTAVSDDVRAYRESLMAEQAGCLAMARNYADAAQRARHAALRAELNRVAVALSKDVVAITMLLQDGRALYRRAG